MLGGVVVSEQLSLLAPSEGGIERIQARLLARHDDPATSKAAAKKMVEGRKLSEQQTRALRFLENFGPGTTWEIADRQDMMNRVNCHYLLARRLPELERKGLVRTTGEVRDGARVWETVSNAV